MKKIYCIIAIFAAALVSCSKPELGTGDAMAPGLNLSIRMNGPATKAGSTMPGVADLNENRIESIAYFVFAGRDDSATLINKGTKSVGADVTESGINVNLSLSEEMFESIIYATGNLRMYVIANASEAFSGLSTVSEIKNQLLTLSKQDGKQDSFVMYGICDAISETAAVGDKRRAVANVELKRLLAKVSFKVTVDKTFVKYVNADGTEVADGETSDVYVRWTSNQNQVKVDFCGLASQTKIAPAAAFKSNLFDCKEKVYSPTENGNAYDCVSSLPYYTYPRTWTIDDETKPYFLISIPWTSELVGTATGDWFKPTTSTTYYKVILGGSFESNNWYAISVALKGLGSLTPGTAVTISPLDLTVADWKDSVEGEAHFHTEAQFQDARVLDIPQESITLYNQNEAQVAFISSHNCEIESVKLGQWNFKKYPVTYNETVLAVADYPFTINNTSKTISFSHALKNDITASSFDFQDYIYTVVVRHSDAEGHAYTDSFTLTQRPALMIQAFANSAGTNGTSNNYVNGVHNSSSDSKYYGGTVDALNATGDSNNNPNMFVISASVMTDGRIIGDPRSLTAESWTSSATCVDVKGESRKLTNYYRTDQNKANVIAPKLRVASSWGKTYTLTYENAVHRCSSYQEDGYPAGRWRIPTRAEVEFIMTLSGKGYIDVLFNNDNNYWCCNGYLKVSSTGNITFTSSTSGNIAVRCVYDEWYWENSQYAKVDKNTPTWGDMKREDFE